MNNVSRKVLAGVAMNPAPGFEAQPESTRTLAATIATPARTLRETLFTISYWII